MMISPVRRKKSQVQYYVTNKKPTSIKENKEKKNL